ncbi:MAG: outer membrane beta-barrel protein [Chitinophagales bacterium]
MIKNTVFAFFALLMSLPAFSQAGIELGVFVMPQSVWVFNKDDSDQGARLDYVPKYSFAYGAKVGFNFSNTIGLQTGLIISKQGQDYDSDGSGAFGSALPSSWIGTDRVVDLTYLKIPLLLKFNSNPDAGTAFLFTIGPQLAFLTSAESTVNDIAESFNGYTLKDLYEQSYIGAVMSIGARFTIAENLFLNTSFRFDGSLGDVENKDQNNHWLSDRPDGRAVTGGVDIGISYNIGG